MKQQLALRVLADAMGWDDEEAPREFAWLRLMSRLKYDTYQGYQPGARFIESLVVWVQQFPQHERKIAYETVRRKLIFVSANELRHLIEQMYTREVQPYLVARASKHFSIPRYLVWKSAEASKWVQDALRRTLFMGLSDGARIDVLRRANVGRISNEQVVLAPIVDHDKWRDLQKELRRDQPSDQDPKFDCVWVIDDLTASGTTLIRSKEVSDEDTGEKKFEWKGKLCKLQAAISDAREKLGKEFPLAEQFDLCVHHYLATQDALDAAKKLSDAARSTRGVSNWFKEVHFSYGMLLSKDVKLKHPEDTFVDLANRYYDKAIEDRHTEESGQKDVRLGYKGCALPLVLEHNTPNNTVALFWADTAGTQGHRMRPLFRRRTRHQA
jgi:hypothetical protein